MLGFNSVHASFLSPIFPTFFLWISCTLTLCSLIYYLLSSFNVACMCMGVGPYTGAWSTSQGSCPWRKVTFPLPIGIPIAPPGSLQRFWMLDFIHIFCFHFQRSMNTWGLIIEIRLQKVMEMTHVFWFFFVSRIDIFKYVIYGIAAAFFVYGILLMVEGFFTTGAIKDLYGDFKITTCGRCVSAWVCSFSALSMKCGLISTAQRCLYSPADRAEAFFNGVTFSSYIFKIKFLN